MNYIEKSVASFNAFAKELLEDHVADLSNIENSFLISGEPARVKIFNTHLNILQQQLEQQISSILNKLISAGHSAHHNELEVRLNNISAQYIHEYMCTGFLKNDASE